MMIRLPNQTEYARLEATCEKCGHNWLPYGVFQRSLPYEDTLTCPNCEEKFGYQWLDTETKIKLKQRELGLSDEEELLNRINQLEKRIEILEKSREVEDKRRELVDAEISGIKTWSQKREKDFLDIETLAKELKEDDQFKQDNK